MSAAKTIAEVTSTSAVSPEQVAVAVAKTCPATGYTGLLQDKRVAVIYTGAVYGPDRGPGFGKDDEESTYEAMKAKLKEVMKNSFRPEFLNRVDDIIVFRGLGKEDIKAIIDIELSKVTRRLGR